MRSFRRLLAASMLLLLGLAPALDAGAAAQGTPSPASANPQDCISDYDPDTDYFPEKVSVQYSQGFSVTYANNYKVVRFSAGSEETGDEIEQTFVLVQCGTPEPALEGDLAGALSVQVPAQSVAVLFGEDAIFLETLGLESRIVGVGRARFMNPALTAHIQNNNVPELGFPPDLELLVGIDPDLAIFFAQMTEDFERIEQVRDLGITAVPSSKVDETTPLGRAEWLKYFALFFNAEAAANDAFTPMARSYESLTAQAGATTTSPLVLWAYPEAGDVYAVQNGWLDALIADAGATNIFHDPVALETEPLSIETVVDRAADADFWITGDVNALYESPPPGADGIQAFRDRNVYDHSNQTPASGGNDYYETGAVRVDLVLQDLVAIFHPELLPDHEPYFFRRAPEAS